MCASSYGPGGRTWVLFRRWWYQSAGIRSSGATDLESLTQEVVHHGLSSSDENEESNLYSRIVNRVERELIYQVMQSCNNVQTKAAARLGINRNTLHKKLKEYGFEK